LQPLGHEVHASSASMPHDEVLRIESAAVVGPAQEERCTHRPCRPLRASPIPSKSPDLEADRPRRPRIRRAESPFTALDHRRVRASHDASLERNPFRSAPRVERSSTLHNSGGSRASVNVGDAEGVDRARRRLDVVPRRSGEVTSSPEERRRDRPGVRRHAARSLVESDTRTGRRPTPAGARG